MQILKKFFKNEIDIKLKNTQKKNHNKISKKKLEEVNLYLEDSSKMPIKKYFNFI